METSVNNNNNNNSNQNSNSQITDQQDDMKKNIINHKDVIQTMKRKIPQMNQKVDDSSFDVGLKYYYYQVIEENDFPVVYFVRNSPQLSTLLDQLPPKVKRDYACSNSFHPDLIDASCQRGYFPMSIPAFETFVLALKIHDERCVLDLQNIKLEKSTIKRSKDFIFTVDYDWEQVCQKIVKRHGENWLNKKLRLAFTTMFLNPTKYKTQFHSFEIWDAKGNLVAGELGFVVGKVYTSLTGFKEIDHAGALQLSLTRVFLKKSGFLYWDFGMSMTYKLEMGAQNLLRKDWHALIAQHGAKQTALSLETPVPEEAYAIAQIGVQYLQTAKETKPAKGTAALDLSQIPEDLSGKSAKELKQIMQQWGISYTDCFEVSDMIEKLHSFVKQHKTEQQKLSVPSKTALKKLEKKKRNEENKKQKQEARKKKQQEELKKESQNQKN